MKGGQKSALKPFCTELFNHMYVCMSAQLNCIKIVNTKELNTEKLQTCFTRVPCYILLIIEEAAAACSEFA